jgi:hypothetical protein
MIPNCVAEYYREQEEREEYESEKRMRREGMYREDELFLKNAEKNGDMVLAFGGYDKCHECRFKSRELMTDDWDDIGRFVCYNKECLEHKVEESNDE